VNVLEARVVLRERSLLDVVDLAVRFCVHFGKSYALLSAFVLVPAFAATWALATGFGWGWGWTAALVLSPFASAPFTALASRLLFEPATRTRHALRAFAAALPSLVAIRLLEGIGLAFGGAILLLPAVWVWLAFFYANEIVVLERTGIGAGVARLGRFIGGGGEALMALLFLTALHIVVVFLGDVVGRGVLEGLLEITPPPSIFESKGSALALFAFWAFVPFGATCRFLLYINARTRTEGWDVQTRFSALAVRARSDAADPRPSTAPRAA
jgi:hypothetical protein